MAGLNGILLDLYVVDRCVDGARARMLATTAEQVRHGRQTNASIDRLNGGSSAGAAASVAAETFPDSWNPTTDAMSSRGERTRSDSSRQRAKFCSAPREQRKTSLGTLRDVQCILELHRIDKIVDKFKRGLQMPVFCEEEAWETNILRELRKVDLEMEECHRKKKVKEESQEDECNGQEQRQELRQRQYRWGGCDDGEEDDWDKDKEWGGDQGDILRLSTESFVTNYDAYLFYDPHEMAAIQSQTYQSPLVVASTSDDLHEIIDLLRTDVEIDGASRRNAELEMIRPLFEMDQKIEKWRKQSNWRDMWCRGDIRTLYLVDLEVDAAKRKGAFKSCKKEQKNGSEKLGSEGVSWNTADTNEFENLKKDDTLQNEILASCQTVGQSIIPIPLAASNEFKIQNTQNIYLDEENISDNHTWLRSQEAKNALAQHIPQVPQSFCPTSPVLVSSQAPQDHWVSPQSSHADTKSNQQRVQPLGMLTLPPAPHITSSEPTKRCIFTDQEKTNASMMHVAATATDVTQDHAKNSITITAAMPTKRSIFSRKEKISAAQQCAFQRGVMMPGTTTIVMVQGGEMIDDIPVGKVVATTNAGASTSTVATRDSQ